MESPVPPPSSLVKINKMQLLDWSSHLANPLLQLQLNHLDIGTTHSLELRQVHHGLAKILSRLLIVCRLVQKAPEPLDSLIGLEK